MIEINNGLMNFIDSTPNAYCCVENIKEILLSNGFKELYENEDWNNLEETGNYFVTKGDSSLIAFKMSSKVDSIGFNITSSHTDSPSFSIKPNTKIFDNGYCKLNVDKYGGMINYSWFDRPLSLAGRVIYLKDGVFKKAIVNIDKDLLIIPSQAIHMNREVNDKNAINVQNDMLPIISLRDLDFNYLLQNVLERQNGEINKICDYDLYLYNRDKAKRCGNDNDFILAPRLDDLGSLYPSLMSFVDTDNKNSINMFCAFNNEEIGSLTQQGADSPFLIETLSRIAKNCEIDLPRALSNSFVISADNAHAIHPNATSKSDPTNRVFLNKGVVIKHNTNYTTDGLSSSIFKQICKEVEVPYQDFACRSDMRCGATLGGISTSHVGIDSVDIGLPQLAMHSSNELIGSQDTLHMYKALVNYYETAIRKEKGTVKLLKK